MTAVCFTNPEVSVRALMCAAVIGMMVMSVGCHHNKDKKDCCTTQMSAKDACPDCPGDQTATANGTCSKCGMKVPA